MVQQPGFLLLYTNKQNHEEKVRKSLKCLDYLICTWILTFLGENDEELKVMDLLVDGSELEAAGRCSIVLSTQRDFLDHKFYQHQ